MGGITNEEGGEGRRLVLIAKKKGTSSTLLPKRIVGLGRRSKTEKMSVRGTSKETFYGRRKRKTWHFDCGKGVSYF